jgi:hypothetical protein
MSITRIQCFLHISDEVLCDGKRLSETLESAPLRFVISTYAGDDTPALVLVEVGSDM